MNCAITQLFFFKPKLVHIFYPSNYNFTKTLFAHFFIFPSLQIYEFLHMSLSKCSPWLCSHSVVNIWVYCTVRAINSTISIAYPSWSYCSIIVYSVKCSVQCPVYTVQYTVSSIHSAIHWTVQCTLYSINCTVHTVQFSVQWRPARLA